MRLNLKRGLYLRAAHFRKNRGGAVAVTFAVSFFAMFVALAVVIDYGRMLAMRERGQADMDGALLHALRDRAATDKAALAQSMFLAAINSSAVPTSTSFTYDATNRILSGQARFDFPMTFGSAWNATASVGVSGSVKSAADKVRALDLAICINAGSYSANTVAFAKAAASDFGALLDAEFAKMGLPKFNQVRVRPIFYRDYGGFLTQFTNDNAGMNMVQGSILNADVPTGTAVGDVPPLNAAAGFYDLSTNAAGLAQFASLENASGGGDKPDSGMECVNEAMDSPWATVGSRTSQNETIDIVYPIIVVFPDAAAHPLGFAYSLANPSYPSDVKMPRTNAQFQSKWAQLAGAQSNLSLWYFGGFPNHPLVNELDGSISVVSNGFALLQTLQGFHQSSGSTLAAKFFPTIANALSETYAQTGIAN